MKKKIAVVITARASYARVKTVLKAIQKKDNLELVIIAAASMLLERTGSPYKVLEKDGLKISEKIYMVVEGENPATMAKTVGIGIMELATLFDNIKPDIVISIADRFETISTAIAASYLNIPVAHIQGGEVTGSIDEKVRHAVTKFSSLHFVTNEFAAKRVRLMGEDPSSIHITGCPSVDIAKEILNMPPITSQELYSKYGGIGTQVDLEKDFVIVMQHPVTTEYQKSQEQMWETLMAINHLKIPTLLFWPNVDAGADVISKAIRVFREKYNPDYVYFLKNLIPEDFLRLLIKSKAIVGNSSVGIRECSFLGVPTVNIGTRQIGRERAENVTDVDSDHKMIINAINKQIKVGKYKKSLLYGNGNSGEKIAEILAKIGTISVEKRFFMEESI